MSTVIFIVIMIVVLSALLVYTLSRHHRLAAPEVVAALSERGLAGLLSYRHYAVSFQPEDIAQELMQHRLIEDVGNGRYRLTFRGSAILYSADVPDQDASS